MTETFPSRDIPLTEFVIYARVSKDPDGTSVSPEAQLAECWGYVDQLGWDRARVTELTDIDLSAYQRKVVRPSFQRIVAGVESGVIEGLVIHDLDRFLRRSRELEALIDVIDRRGGRFPIHSPRSHVDLSTPEGRVMARIQVAIAEKESDDKSRRLKLVLGQKARDGKPHGGNLPYGWMPDRVTVNPDEATVIRDLADWLLDGVTLEECCRRLTAADVPTRRGGPWRPITVRNVTTNPRVAGYRVHNGEIVARGEWETILDDRTWRALCELFDARRTAPSVRRSWCSAVTRCDRCGGAMRSSMIRKGYRVYLCDPKREGCGVTIAADPVDVIVETVLLGLLTHVPLQDRRVDTAELEGRIAGLEADLEVLSHDFYVDHLIERAEFTSTRAILDRRLERARRELAAARDVKGGDQDAATAWPKLNVHERADLVARVFDRVLIAPFDPSRRGRFDPTRVTLVRARRGGDG